MPATHTWNEIASQPLVWQATLDRFNAAQSHLELFIGMYDPDHIIAIGCGSTYYLARAAAATLNYRVAVPARAMPASELWLYGDMPVSDNTILLAISRSGETSETLMAAESFKGLYGRPVLAVTCDPSSSLTRTSAHVLACPDAQEQSVAQTRSFSSMYLLTLALGGLLADDEQLSEQVAQLPAALTDLIERLDDLPEQLGRDMDIQRFFFLGNGALYGLACEGMLKTKEMSLSYAEAFHPLEFRHGPMSMVDEHSLIVGLLSDTALRYELQVLRDMQALGGRTLALIDDSSKLGSTKPDHVVELGSGLDEWARGALCLPVMQRIAFHRAIANGLDPDRPHNLKAVVEL